MYIDEYVLKRASRCQHEYRCLNEEIYCQPECLNLSVENEKCTVLECHQECHCIYKIDSYGIGVFCGCPVRRYIFQNYGK